MPIAPSTLLSLGAGGTPYRPPDDLLESGVDTLDWGYRQWIVLAPHLLLKVLFDGAVVAAHFSCKGKLRDRYHRIQPPLPEDIDLAAAAKVPLLMAVADGIELEEATAWVRIHWS